MNSNRLRPDPVLETQCFALPWSSGALSIVIAHLERLELAVMLQRHLPSNRNELHVCCTFSHKGVSSPTTPNRLLRLCCQLIPGGNTLRINGARSMILVWTLL